MFFFFFQIVLDPLALQMRRQRTPSARAGLILIATAGARATRKIVIRSGIGLHFRRGVGKLSTEFLCEQSKLIGAQLFAARAAFGREQLRQQPLRFVQLRGQIDQHLLQDYRIFRQTVAVDGHYGNYIANALQDQAQNASKSNVYEASTHLR